MGGGGRVFDVLVVRGTFDIADGVVLRPALVQQAPLTADELERTDAVQPLTAVVRRAGDLVIHKPATDIHVVGTARSVGERPVPHWLAGVAIGNTCKVLRLSGPRAFQLGLWNWRLTKPEPTASVVLDYRRAFGGCFPADDGACYKPDNPAGAGWLPNRRILARLENPRRKIIEQQLLDLRQLPAPQMDDPREPVAHPEQSLAAQGFGPVARWCKPRLNHLGTRDALWLRTRSPEYPDDFDPRFFQSAHPDLICPGHLIGGEPVVLAGLLPEGRIRTALPSIALRVEARGDDGRRSICRTTLDTVCIDLDTRTVALTWRTTLPVDLHLREAWIRQQPAGRHMQGMQAA